MRLTITLAGGEYRAHRAGCAGIGCELADHEFMVDAENQLRAARIAYADQIGEGSMTAADALGLVKFMSCTGDLPAGPVLASQLSDDDLETLVRTAAELWATYNTEVDPDDVLSARQREVLEKTAALWRKECGDDVDAG